MVKQMKIEKALERIELQLKAIWWDNLMYSCWIVSLLTAVIGILTKNLIVIIMAIILYLIIYPLIQICEYFEKNKIRRLYKK